MPASTRPEFRVLIIEDADEVAETYAVALRPYFDVEKVRTVADASVRLTDAKQPDGICDDIDCILLDLHLSNGQGVALVDNFQNKFPCIPIVVVSSRDVDPASVILAGAHAFLRKPDFGATILINTIIQSIVRHKVRGQFAPITRELIEVQQQLESSIYILEQAKTAFNKPRQDAVDPMSTLFPQKKRDAGTVKKE